MKAILLAALVHVLGVLAPPARLAALPAFPGWAETAEERSSRYDEIAQAALAVALDPRERPLFAGSRGRARTASLLLAVAFEETGFARDADLGPCYRTGPKDPRCDHGKAACLLQIEVGDGRTREGWTRADLFADREKCFRAGLHLMRSSFLACGPTYGADHALDAYASGGCNLLGSGPAKGKKRLATGRRVYELAGGKLLAPDAELLAEPVAFIDPVRLLLARRE